MSEAREQALDLPEAVMDDLLQAAARHDRSVSWCVQRAWALARDALGQSGPQALALADAAAEAPTGRHNFHVLLPAAMLREIAAEAERLDSSLSSVVRSAWSLAAPEFAGLRGAPRP